MLLVVGTGTRLPGPILFDGILVRREEDDGVFWVISVTNVELVGCGVVGGLYRVRVGKLALECIVRQLSQCRHPSVPVASPATLGTVNLGFGAQGHAEWCS